MSGSMGGPIEKSDVRFCGSISPLSDHFFFHAAMLYEVFVQNLCGHFQNATVVIASQIKWVYEFYKYNINLLCRFIQILSYIIYT